MIHNKKDKLPEKDTNICYIIKDHGPFETEIEIYLSLIDLDNYKLILKPKGISDTYEVELHRNTTKWIKLKVIPNQKISEETKRFKQALEKVGKNEKIIII
ncbi:MAG: hypothetical protein GF317_06025 [Candidatus Lokiarchaeota archaeon]|nr:hypothetical protein [Candidatus Lokiarchaeota archaeon]